MKTLVIGAGYVGFPLAASLAKIGHQVTAIRRAADPEAMLSAGIQPCSLDITQPGAFKAVPAGWDWVVFCAGASGSEPEQYRNLYYQGLKNILEWLAAFPPRKLVYTSSTGVYAQDDGSWVDESCPAEPRSETGRILVDAEKLVLGEPRLWGVPGVVLRVSGIYGPGRGYWFKQFLQGHGQPLSDPDRFLNMVHRDDVVGAILTALQTGQPGQVYNVSDHEPVTLRRFLQWLALQLKRPMPDFSPAPPAPPVSRRSTATNKRIANRRLIEELQFRFIYPTYREGYANEVQSALQKPAAGTQGI